MRSHAPYARFTRHFGGGHSFQRRKNYGLGWKLALCGVGILVLTFGLLTVILVALGGFAIFLLRPRPQDAKPVDAAKTALPDLIRKQRVWLGKQRRALPYGAQVHLIVILRRLDQLEGKVLGLSHGSAIANDLRRLVGDDLPQLIACYTNLSPDLRSERRDGISGESELVQGLAILESELARLWETLGDTDAADLAAHSRYLDMKYGGTAIN